MKHFAAVLLALAAAAPVLAQAPDDGAERARLKAEREAADAKFEQARRACYGKFAVNDCINEVTREHNAVAGELRRQERILNDAERRRRAAEAQKDIDERSSPERRREAEEKRQRALQEQADRERRAAEKAARRAQEDAQRAKNPPRVKTPGGPHGPQGAARTPPAPKSPQLSPDEVSRNRAAHAERLREAAQHKAEVQSRVAKRTKPPASALPVPQ